jgi:hypothetical protein
VHYQEPEEKPEQAAEAPCLDQDDWKPQHLAEEPSRPYCALLSDANPSTRRKKSEVTKRVFVGKLKKEVLAVQQDIPGFRHRILGAVNIRRQGGDAEALEAVVDKNRDLGPGWG